MGSRLTLANRPWPHEWLTLVPAQENNGGWRHGAPHPGEAVQLVTASFSGFPVLPGNEEWEGIVKKVLMVGLGPVVDGDWKPRKFTLAGALAYLRRTMAPDLKRYQFVPVVADIGPYYRGNYAAMPEKR